MKTKLLALLVFLTLATRVVYAQATISAVTYSSPQALQATVTWTTNITASSQVIYGSSPSALNNSTAVNYAAVTSHSMAITVSGSTNYYAVISVDASGNKTQSSTFGLTTCGNASIPITATATPAYQFGTYTLTYVAPSGAGSAPTICGVAAATSATGSLTASGSFSTSVALVGTWTVAMTDAGNVGPVSISGTVLAQSNDYSLQIQAAVLSSGSVVVIATRNGSSVWPPITSGSGTVNSGTGIAYYNPAAGTAVSGANLTGLVYGNGGSAPTVATQQQINAIANSTTALVGAGDSRMAGNTLIAGQDLLTRISQLPLFSAAGTIHNGAVGGATCASMTSAYSANVVPYKPNGTTIIKSYLFILEGINDLLTGGLTAAQVQNCYQSYLAQASSDGFTPVVLTSYWSTALTDTQATQFILLNSWFRSLAPKYLVIDADEMFPSSVVTPGFTTASPWYGAGSSATAITAYSIASGVATFTVANSYTSGQIIYLSGFATSTFLNGQTSAASPNGILVISANSTSFTALIPHVNVSTTTESGVGQLIAVDQTHLGPAGVLLLASGISDRVAAGASGTTYVPSMQQNYVQPQGGIQRFYSSLVAGTAPTTGTVIGDVYANRSNTIGAHFWGGDESTFFFRNGNSFLATTPVGINFVSTAAGGYTFSGGNVTACAFGVTCNAGTQGYLDSFVSATSGAIRLGSDGNNNIFRNATNQTQWNLNGALRFITGGSFGMTWEGGSIKACVSGVTCSSDTQGYLITAASATGGALLAGTDAGWFIQRVGTTTNWQFPTSSTLNFSNGGASNTVSFNLATGAGSFGAGSTVNTSLICTAAGVAGCATGTVSSGTIDGIAYYSGATALSSTTAPTTTGQTFFPCWQPSGSAVAPTPCNLTNNSLNPGFFTLTAGSSGQFQVTSAGTTSTTAPLQAQTLATTLSAPTIGTSCSGNLIVNGAGIIYTCSGSIWIAASGTPATWAVGSGVTSVTCADASSVAVTCTSASGSLVIVGGTATTGTIATATWTAETAKRKCSFTMNGNGSTGTAGFDIGHTAPTASGVSITAGLTVLGATLFVDYACAF